MAADAARIAQIPRLEQRGRLLRAGFGVRHIDATAKSFDPPTASAVLWTKTLQGECVALLGSYGRGKTQMACELCRAWIARNPVGQPLYTTAARMMETLKRAWGGDGPDPRNAWRSAPILVIDDFHLGYDKDANDIEIGDLLDARYYDKRATVILANLRVPEFMAKVGKRITSRINDGGGVIELQGEDRRVGGAA